MNFLKSFFGKKDTPITTNKDFWDWFTQNEKAFFVAVKQQSNIAGDFFDKLSPKLAELKSGFYFVTGMKDSTTAELVLTADGDIGTIAFVEDLVSEAPKLSNWLFTALKPALNIKDVNIKMAGYKFSSDNLFFYPEEIEGYPDLIDIKIVHNDFLEKEKNTFSTGTYIFLDNFLGELNLATTVDRLTVIGKESAEKELIPIEKLKAYLIWREKEFIEKYDGMRHNTDNDTYASLEATLNNGLPLIAIVNTDLLHWDAKASHPWVVKVQVKYDGEGNNGLPDNKTYELLNLIEDDILKDLKDADGYLDVGRQTADGLREIYFACNDFRKPSKVLFVIQKKYVTQLSLTYDIYKDKYWDSFDHLIN